MKEKKKSLPQTVKISQETIDGWRKLIRHHQSHLAAAKNSNEPLKAAFHTGAMEALKKVAQEFETP